MKLRKSFVVLLIALVLLFAPAVLSIWVDLTPSNNLIRASELAVTLLGIFLVAHYELQHLERRLREERKQEVRQQKLNTLDYIESWLSDVSSTIEDSNSRFGLGLDICKHFAYTWSKRSSIGTHWFLFGLKVRRSLQWQQTNLCPQTLYSPRYVLDLSGYQTSVLRMPGSHCRIA